MVPLVSSSFGPLAAALAVTAAATACSNGGTSPSTDAAYGEEFRLGVGETKRVGGDGLTLRFDGVPSDSRCPVDVTCVWEGEALVELRAQAPSAEARTLEVRIRGTGGSGETEYAGRFEVRVTKLEPAPVSTAQIPADAYRATLVVTRP